MGLPTVLPVKESAWIDLQAVVFPPHLENLDVEDVDCLADDMNARGQLHEIVVTPFRQTAVSPETFYEVLAGIRRVLAARRLGWGRIRAFIREDISDYDKADISYSENEHRARPSPFRQAALFQKMMREKKCTPIEFVEIMKRREPHAAQYLSLLELPSDIRKQFERCELSLEEIGLLMHLPNNADRSSIAADYINGKWTTHQLKDRIQAYLIPKAPETVLISSGEAQQ